MTEDRPASPNALAAAGAAPPAITVAVLAHNEQRRIARCLDSLPLGDSDVAIHVAVNGSHDATAAIGRDIAAQAGNVTVHDWPEGGKSRSWNRLVFDTLGAFSPAHVFVDGDAVISVDAVHILARELATHPEANAIAGMPLNGRSAAAYRRELVDGHGIFGDLYAVRGDFLARMKARGIRLPVDLIGDDGLIAALVRTDLGDESDWRDSRVAPSCAAGFFCEPFALTRPAGWRLQYRRMITYSLRHFQNRIISEIMRGGGPTALPERLAERYPALLAAAKPRRDPVYAWFDRLALRRMARAVSRP